MSRIFLTLTLFAGMFSSCNASQKENKTTEITTMETPSEPTTGTENKNWKDTPGLYAQIQTAKGNIVISLFYKQVPVTVANFVGLTEGKIKNTAKADGVPFYDGLNFHRVIHTPQPFMIQGGDPQGTGAGGPGYSFGDEFDPSLAFDKVGLLAMANSGPATNGSQFFITEAATTWLNNKHTIFGETVEGYPLVTSLVQGEVMTKVTIIRVGKEAQAFDAVGTFAKKEEILAAKKAAFLAKQEEMNKSKTMPAAELVKRDYPTAIKTASGLYYVVEKVGTGAKAEKGKTVFVHYAGKLADGTKFDSSYDRNQPLDFILGTGRVIAGWDEGIALMNVGSKLKLIIPASLGYGAQGAGGVIPANATLIFDTELMDVK